MPSAEIAEGLGQAATDPSVKSIELEVDSSGGEVDGLFALFDQLAAISSQKKIDVIAHKAQSAAYGISAATGGKIIPSNSGSVFGSIGVAASFFVDPQVVDIASTNAPNKRPNLLTEEGKRVVREELDQIHDAFVDVIARGRSAATGKTVTAAYVNESYGRGGSMLAVQAHAAGLIDAKPKKNKLLRQASAEQEVTTNGERDMKFSEYLAAHPEHAKAALSEERAKEQARCASHMKLAKKSGCYDLALSAIESGISANDSSVVFDHLEAKGRTEKVGDRQKETDKVATQLAGVLGETATPDLGDLLADAVGAPRLEN